MMKTKLPYSLALLLCAVTAQVSSAADLKVIANTSVGVTSLSVEELKGAFLSTKTSLSDGSHVEPVIEKSGPVHQAFLKAYLGKTEAAARDLLPQSRVH